MKHQIATIPPQPMGQWNMAKRIGISVLVLSVLGGGLSGCININAPEEPIVIQLDINIRAEIVRLAEDAQNTIDDNDEGIF